MYMYVKSAFLEQKKLVNNGYMYLHRERKDFSATTACLQQQKRQRQQQKQ
jgi:hypothetical protein